MCGIFEIFAIVMLVGGLIALFKGELSLTKTRKVTGKHAYILGSIMVAPVVLIFVFAVALRIFMGIAGVDPEKITEIIGYAATAIVLVFVLVTGALFLSWTDKKR